MMGVTKRHGVMILQSDEEKWSIPHRSPLSE